jgi:ubiquinone biosynthesis protein UbiJ
MNFRERIEKVISNGLEASRDALEKAAEKTREAGERGTIRMKIRRLETEAESKFAQLGSNVYEVLVEEGRSTVSKATKGIKETIAEIQQLDAEIQELEKQFEQVGKKEE